MANRKARRAAERKGIVAQRPKEQVCFANVNPGNVTCELFGTFVHLLTQDMTENRHINGFIVKRSGGLLSIFRNGVVAEFVGEAPESDWIWMVDSDIVLDTQTLNLLMDARHAHPEAKIISGWYVLPMGPETGMIPSTYRWSGGDWRVEGDFENIPVPDEVCYVDSVGIGCCLVKRDLLTRMMQRYGRPSPWFTIHERAEAPGVEPRIFGEDHSFFQRAAEFGQRPLLVPQAEVGHMKSMLLSREHLTSQESNDVIR